MDSGLFFDMDDPPAPLPRQPKAMNSIRRSWTRYIDAQKLDLLNKVVAANENNPDVPPCAAFTELKAKTAAANTADAAATAHDLLTKPLHTARLDTIDSAMESLAPYASIVEGTVCGDRTKILNAGFDYVGPGSTAPVAMTQVVNLTVTIGDNDGELDVMWAPVDSARVYEVQTAPLPSETATWTSYGTPQSKSSITLAGLTSGQRTWVRVRAIGAGDASPGPFSDPAFSMVP